MRLRADLHLRLYQEDEWKLTCFHVMQKELALLRVSVLGLTHNPISVSSQSLSAISTKLSYFNFLYF